MSINFRYKLYDILAGTFLGEIRPRDPKWVESVNGGSTWTGVLTIPEANPIYVQNLSVMTALGMSLFILTPEGLVPWCGYISGRSWDSSTNELTITALEWRTYLYRLLATPQDDYDPVELDYTGQDQVEIARDLLTTFTSAGLGAGVPQIDVGINLTGVDRDLLVRSTLFRSVGTWIDSMANRDNGFEWDIEGGFENDGTPKLTFQTYYPQRGGVIDGLVFRYGKGGNLLTYRPIDESNDDMATRVWAVGSGPDSDSLPYAQDSDPDMMAGASVLRLEKATTYQDVVEQATLESYARAEREFLGVPLSLLTFYVRDDQPYAYDYLKGDRCRIIIKDRWQDLDVSNARIVQRTLQPDDRLVEVVVDLNDLELPDTDPNGSV